MRILQVVHRLYPPTIGGLSFHVNALSQSLASLGHEVTVLTTKEGLFSNRERRHGYEIVRYSPIASPLDNPLPLRLLTRLLLIKKGEFDIIHAHSHLLFATNFAALKRRISDIPLVITNHGYRVKRQLAINLIQDIYLATLGRWTLRAADAVINLTEKERENVLKAGVPPESAFIISNGVDTSFFHPIDVDRIPNSILWAGRFVPEKGLQYLIEAMAKVAKEIPSARLFLVGQTWGRGGELKRMKELSKRLDLNNNIAFLQPRPQEELVKLINACQAFALPSLTEGFPSALLEAMACEKPAIVTDGIGLNEVARDASIYTPPKDSHALARAIISLLKDEDFARRLGKRARQQVVRNYDWRIIVAAIITLYKRIIES